MGDVELETAEAVKRRLRAARDAEKAAFYPRFFKTGPGEYGEGDRFHGVTVPKCRAIARSAGTLSLKELSKLLDSAFHEERAVALFVLVRTFERAKSEEERRAIFDFYHRHLDRVNQWDLVDASAPAIVGGFLVDKSRARLRRLVRSRSLWRRRVAVLATLAFIKRGEHEETLDLAVRLLDDPEDLIHKATGWMLREVGKRDPSALRAFLDEHCRVMPRTMLRYAIERLPPAERRAYLAGEPRSGAELKSNRSERSTAPRSRPRPPGVPGRRAK